jgi:hypothetical protein
MAQSNTLTWTAGEHVRLNFTMSPVVDLTGATLLFTLKAQRSRTMTNLFTVAGVLVSGPAGTFYVDITAAVSDVPVGSYYHDVWRTDAGNEAQLSTGPVTVADRLRT